MRRLHPAARRCTCGHAGHGEHGAAVEQHLDVHRRLQRGEAGRSCHRRARRRDAARRARKGRRRIESVLGPGPIAIMEKQVAALVSNARGQKDEALKLAKEAMEIELALSAPSGPARSDQAGAGVLRRAAARGRKNTRKPLPRLNFRCNGPRTGRRPSKPCSGRARRAPQCDNYVNPNSGSRTARRRITYEETRRPRRSSR